MAALQILKACLLTFCFWSLTQAINSDCRCWEHPIFRRACRFGDWLNEENCHLAGCCYDDKTPSYEWPRPVCYEKKGLCPTNEKCIVYSGREVCGHRAMGRTLCEMKGCCYDNSQYPFCYQPKSETTVTSTTTTQTERTPTTKTETTKLTTTPRETTTVEATTTSTLISTTVATSTPGIVTSSTMKHSTSSVSEATTTVPNSVITTSTGATTTSQLPETSSPTPTTSTVTTSNPFTYLGGPFGFFQIGTMVIYSQCPTIGNSSCLDGSIMDQSNCTRNRCCWNGDLVGGVYNPCYRPSIHVINWPDPDKNITALPMWTPWSPWSKCWSQPCQAGIHTRERTCENGVPGISCTGIASDGRICAGTCYTSWGPWTSWSECDMACGPGNTTRRRSCFNNDSNVVSNTDCPAEDSGSKEVARCQDDYCSSWSPWIAGPCSSSCGRGIRNNTRICYSETIPNTPPDCYYVTAVCNDAPCAPLSDVKPMWGPWTPWSRCSDPCGTGTRSRVRMCYDEITGESIRTGSRLHCGEGQGFQISSCNTGICSAWSNWASTSLLCNAACGITETRSCVGTAIVPPPFACSRRTVPCMRSPCV